MIALYTLFFGSWFISNFKKYGYNISSFLLSLYLAGTLCCLIIIYFFPDYIKYPERITWQSVGTHILLLSMVMWPILNWGNSIKVSNIKIPDKALKRFSWFIVICSLSTIIVSITDIIRIFAFGDFKIARDAYLDGDLGTSSQVNRYGAIGYFSTMGTLVSFIATFLFFYYRFYLKRRSHLIFLLLLSSFAVAINNLSISGRDGLIRCILFYAANFCLFKKYITYKGNKLFFITTGTILTMVAIIFSAISIDRFSDSQLGVVFSIARYGGEQFYLFSYNFHRFNYAGMFGFESMFPLIFGENYNPHNLNDQFSADFFLNTFSTFAGSFVQRIGVWNAFVFSLICFIILSIVFFRRHIYTPSISFGKMILFLLSYEVILLGFFYYMHYSRVIQLYLGFTIILAYILSSKRKIVVLLNHSKNEI